MSFDLQLVATVVLFIMAITRLTNQANLYLAGSSNSPTSIRATTNFLNWTNPGSLRLTNGSALCSDPRVTNFKARFYQAMRAIP